MRTRKLEVCSSRGPHASFPAGVTELSPGKVMIIHDQREHWDFFSLNVKEGIMGGISSTGLGARETSGTRKQNTHFSRRKDTSPSAMRCFLSITTINRKRKSPLPSTVDKILEVPSTSTTGWCANLTRCLLWDLVSRPFLSRNVLAKGGNKQRRVCGAESTSKRMCEKHP